MIPSSIRRLIERILPWYDPEYERLRDRRTESMRQRSVKARIEAEHVRAAYLEYADRLERP